MSLQGFSFGVLGDRRRRTLSGRWLALALLAAVATVVPSGCRKKNDAVEAVDTAGKKAPVVGRKSRDPAKAVDAPRAATPSVAPGLRPQPPAMGASPPPSAVAAPSSVTPSSVAPSSVAPSSAPAAAALAAVPAGMPPSAIVPAEAPLRPGRGAAAAETDAALRPSRGAPSAEAAPEAPRLGGETPEAAPPARPLAAPPPGSGEPALDVTGYLSVGDLERVLGAKANLRRADLLGTQASPGYNFLYFNKGKGDDFGVSVQVWRDSNPAESRTRFATMKNTYSNVAPTNKVADQGFRSFFGGVVTLVFADPRRPMVAAVSCSTKTCTADQMLELSRRVAERLH